jgi:hypothetical protein
MTQELHYTSLPRGLKPGSRGFCTVASTPHMAGPLVERLESLSGYQPVYPVHDPAAARNPVNFMHVKLAIGGKTVSVLSRVGPAGLDYSGRTSKYAHHVVLEANERPVGGPAWALSQPGFLKSAWEGEPRILEEGSRPPQGDRPVSVARAWQTLTGDAGWAGVMAESFLADPKRPALLVFRAGMDLLPLFVEVIALLPPSRRWDVEFSSYFNTLPQGVNCPWRGVLEGSTEADNALRLPNALVINLCRTGGKAEGRALVQQARTGESAEPPSALAEPSGTHAPARPPSSSARRPGARTPDLPTRGAPRRPDGSYNVVPPLVAGSAPRGSPARGRAQNSSGAGRAWMIAAGVGTVCLAGMAAAVFSLFPIGSAKPETPGKAAKPQNTNLPADDRQQAIPQPDVVVANNAPGESPSPARAPAHDRQSAAQGATLPTTETNKAALPNQPPRAPNVIDMATGPPKLPQSNSLVGPPKPRTAVADESNGADGNAAHDDLPASEPAKSDHTSERNGPAPRQTVLSCNLDTLHMDASGPPTLKLTPNLEPGVAITKLSVIHLSAMGTTDSGPNTASTKLISKSGNGSNASIEVMISKGLGEDQPVAQFGVKDGKITFNWDDDASKNESRKNLLRNSVLEITTNEKNVSYALLRERPDENEYTEPLRIRRKKTDDTKARRELYEPLHARTRLFADIPWEKNKRKDYSYLNDRMLILEIKAPLLESTKDLKLSKDETGKGWVLKLKGVEVMKATIGAKNDIRFAFSQDPYELRARDQSKLRSSTRQSSKGENPEIDTRSRGAESEHLAKQQSDPKDTLELIEMLLDADYSMILGLRFGDRDVELVRIGSYATP